MKSEKLRVFELFAGYGSQSLALKYLSIPHVVVGYAEIDDAAIKAYDLLHDGKGENYGDVSKIDASKLPSMDLLTYSFPCTDLTFLGLRKGLAEGSGTRSSLLWESFRVIKEKKPKYLLMENVVGLLSKNNEAEFRRWCAKLESLGYTNSYDVLDAQDYAIPQHRERVIMVSTLCGNVPVKLKSEKKRRTKSVTLRGFLDASVDRKYVLSPNWEDKASVDMSLPKTKKNLQLVGYISGPPRSNGTYGRGNAGAIYSLDSVCPTLIAGCGTGGNNVPHIYIGEQNGNKLIRRLTPRECFKLMGLREPDINKLMSSGLPDSKLYKLAGNSIVIDVLKDVFSKMLAS